MRRRTLLQVLHKDGHLPERASQFPLKGLPLQDKCADGEEVIVATHALVVPGVGDTGRRRRRGIRRQMKTLRPRTGKIAPHDPWKRFSHAGRRVLSIFSPRPLIDYVSSGVSLQAVCDYNDLPVVQLRVLCFNTNPNLIAIICLPLALTVPASCLA